jgi:surface-anchored protein
MGGTSMNRSLLMALTGILLLPAPASAQVLSEGHVDYAARVVDGQLRSLVKDGTRGGEPVWREPGDVVFAIGSAARTTVPSGPRGAFLGRPGDQVWMIPQVQRPGVLWAGWNTEELSPAQIDGPLTWTLAAVDGPGDVAVFQTGAFGDIDILFRSNDGLPDARAIALGTHAHGNWSFSREGEYRLTFTMTARRTTGETISDTRVLPVTVLPPAGAAPTPVPTPGPAPSPDAPATPGTPPQTAPPAATPTLRASSPRLRGRTLSFRLRLGVRSRVAVTLRRGGRTSARAKTRTVAAGDRTLKVLLDRRPRAGRHTVRITATASGRSLKTSLTLR